MVKPSRKTQAPIALLLLPTLLCAILPSCSAPTNNAPASQAAEVKVEQLEKSSGMPVVTLLADTYLSPGIYNQLSKTFESLPGYNRDFMINVEYLPREGVDRENAATRIRTEIIAGKGPDLFLCGSSAFGYWSSGFDSLPFFHFPEQAMDNCLLLPLDGYIENAEYMEWDQLLPVVMEAGRNEEGQMVLPLAYSVLLSAFDKEAYTPPFSLPCTWEEMLESGDPAMMNAANVSLSYVMEPIADYAKDAPLVSEEELLVYAKKLHSIQLSLPSGGLEDIPGSFFCQMNRNGLGWGAEALPMGENAPEYWMIPAYNSQGGVTAWVSVYAAINRNARHPDLAFKIVDYLLSEKVQKSSAIYRELFDGYPVYMGLGSKEAPLDGGWHMNDGNFQEYQNIVGQINQVLFPGPIEKAMHLMGGAHLSEAELEKNVHEQYMLIKMLLAES